MARKLIMSAAILLCAGMLVAGCHKHRSRNHHHAIADPLVFAYSASLTGDTAEDIYVWDNVTDWAFVEFSAHGFWGEFQVEIFDDFGDLIYYETFVGYGDDFYVLDETKLGFYGEWVIVITTYDAYGEVDLDIF